MPEGDAYQSYDEVPRGVSRWTFDSELDWMKAAACVGMPTEAFFPSTRGGRASRKGLPCQKCSVIEACGRLGLLHEQVTVVSHAA